MKRVFLFLATNIAIIFVLSITLRILGVERILDEQGVGLDLNSLLVFAAVFVCRAFMFGFPVIVSSSPVARVNTLDVDPWVSVDPGNA